MEANFSTDWDRGRGWLGDISSALHVLCTLFLLLLLQLHLRSSGIRFLRLRTPALNHCIHSEANQANRIRLNLFSEALNTKVLTSVLKQGLPS